MCTKLMRTLIVLLMLTSTSCLTSDQPAMINGGPISVNAFGVDIELPWSCIVMARSISNSTLRVMCYGNLNRVPIETIEILFMSAENCTDYLSDTDSDEITIIAHRDEVVSDTRYLEYEWGFSRPLFERVIADSEMCMISVSPSQEMLETATSHIW